MPMKTFINLPVEDLNKSMGFFTRLGFTFNAQFTNTKAACMVISEDAYVMLLSEPFFQEFTTKEIANAKKTAEVIIAISTDSREKADGMVKAAYAAGGKKYREADDKGFMYSCGFQDIDGHVWEIIYMDPEYVLKDSELKDVANAGKEKTEHKAEHKTEHKK